tara:strand:- start:4713 stop:5186 length:474 start_codon:yes stop_codon:yes gene_type:complete
MINKKALPLRIGVGIILLNNENKVFVGKRRDNPIDKWQMPQGGVDKNENMIQAMKRELYEETSVKSIKIIKELDEWYEYLLPDKLVGIIWKGKFKGQKQKWFITRFVGDESEINVKTVRPEFIEWKWIEVKKLPDVIVEFKKHIYLELVKEIKKFTN